MATISRRSLLQAASAVSALGLAPFHRPSSVQGALSSEPPILYPEQLRSLTPGTAFQLSGFGFESTVQLRIWAIPDSTSAPSAGITPLPNTPPLGSLAATPAGVFPTSLATVITGAARATMAIYASSGDGTSWSAPLLLNGADPWFATRGEAAPAESFGLVGVNLALAGKTPVVYLRDSGGALTPCSVSVDSSYELTVTIPAGTSIGHYALLVSNGSGGHYAYSDKLSIEVAAATTPPVGVVDVVADFGADPTGTIDATTSIQAALSSAAATPGGSVVSFPAGTYIVSGRITVPTTSTPVHIVGEGSDTTTIQMSDSSSFGADFVPETNDDVYGVGPTDQKSLLYVDQGEGRVVVRDITINTRTRRAVGVGINRRNNVTLERLTVVANNYPENIWLRTGAVGVFVYGTRNTRVLDCVIDANACVRTGAVLDLEVSASDLRLCYPRVNGEPNHPQNEADNTAITISGGRRAVIRHNTITRSSSTFYYARGFSAGGSKLHSYSYGPDDACAVEEVIVAHNSIDGPGEPGGNNGEALINDTFATKPGERIQLPVLAATATTVSVSPGTFNTGSNFDITGAYVFVLSGNGEGQVRRVGSYAADSVTVDEPWMVVPDSTSTIVVALAHVRQLYVHNSVSACPKYLGTYGPTFHSVCAQNVFDSDGAVTSSSAPDVGVGGAAALRGTSPGYDYKLQFYNEVSDNEINAGRAFYGYANSAGATVAPVGAIIRSNAVLRNSTTNSAQAAKLYAASAAPAAAWGQFNLVAQNDADGSGLSAEVGVGFSSTYYQGPTGGLADSGSGTVIV